MKKIMFFGLMVMMSVMVFGTSVAGETVKSDNRVASVVQERLAAEQTRVANEGIVIAKLDIEIEYDQGLCKHLEKECADASPGDQDPICVFWTEDNCPQNPPPNP